MMILSAGRFKSQSSSSDLKTMRRASHRRMLALFGAAAITAATVGGAQAESLADAIALAYQNNPSLKVQREQLKGLDEQFVQASQNLRPQLSFDGVLRNTEVNLGRGFDTNVTSSTLGFSASQVLSTFGRTTAQISVVEAQILSQREALRQVEGDIILSVIEAYASVRRDESRVDYANQAVQAFLTQADQSRARLRSGDGTLTDIGQAEAQLALTQSQLAQAQAALQQSRSNYTRLVGQNPGTLEPPPALPNLPAAVQAAYDSAMTNSPTILQSVLAERGGRAAVQAAQAGFRPTLSLTGQFAYTGVNPFEKEDINQETIIGLSLSQPIFNGGFLNSRVREAQANNRALVANVEVARRQVVDTISGGWNRIVTAETQMRLGDDAVRAARQSAQGARLEFDEGFRSFFEVLNEQQRLLEAQNLVSQAEYDRLVGQAVVLNAIGQIDVEKLVSGMTAYDPAANFDRVKRNGGTPLDPIIALIDRATGPSTPSSPPLTMAPVPAGISIVPGPATSVGAAGLSTSVPTQADSLGALIQRSSQTAPAPTR